MKIGKICTIIAFVVLLGSFSVQGVFAAVQDQHNQFQNIDLEWHNGDINHINSAYAEGDVVPYRFELTGLPGDTDIYLTIDYKFTKGGKYAFDFLATYDLTESAAILSAGGLFADSTPLSTLTEVEVDFTALEIPDDPAISTDDLLVGPQYFAIGGDVVKDTSDPNGPSVIPVPFTLTGDTTGDSEKSITLKITTTSGDDLELVLAWGGHLAIGDGADNWPLGHGSGSISGAPYHQSVSGFVDQNGNGEADGGEKIGPGDRSIHNVSPFVVPEVAFGTIAALATMFGVFGLYAINKKHQ